MPAASVYVAVIGPSADATPALCAVARDVGRLLGQRGSIVLTGGLGGVMAAAAEGASSAGGLSVGLLPGTDRRAGNPYSSVLLATGLGELRNAMLMRSADAVIAVGGSWGTLSEIALAARADVPLVCIDGWTMRDAAGEPVALPTVAGAADAVAWVLERVRPRNDAISATDAPRGKMEG